MDAILYIGISQTLFAGILIALKRPRMLANQILAVLDQRPQVGTVARR